MNKILEKVQNVNVIASKHARIFREYIWFAKPEKPFARTDERTGKRRDTVLLYNDEIIQFYNDIAQYGNVCGEVDFSSPTTISKDLKTILITINIAAIDQIQGDDNLLHPGAGSLTASRIAN